MEQEKVLILNNLGTVYPGLYDLFNQNFTIIGNKSYARIAMGHRTNAYSYVNEKFRCIVNVEEDKISKEEPPFLNRFEKHIISFENLLDENTVKKSNEIYETLLKLTIINKEDKRFEGINYSLKDIFINLDKEEINGYIYQLLNNKVKFDDLTGEVISKLSLLLPQDIIFYLKYSGFETQKREYTEKILDGYKKGKHNNLISFLKEMKDRKNVVYTFSDIFNEKNVNVEISNKMLGDITKDNVTEIEISSYSSENKFEDKLNDGFFNEENKKLCLIKFNSDERHFLNYVKFLIENKEKELNNNGNYDISKKAYVFIVNVYRKYNYIDPVSITKIGEDEKVERNKYNETISLTSEFYQIFIDDLDGSDQLTLNDFLELKSNNLFTKCIDYNVRLNNIWIILYLMNLMKLKKKIMSKN